MQRRRGQRNLFSVCICQSSGRQIRLWRGWRRSVCASKHWGLILQNYVQKQAMSLQGCKASLLASKNSLFHGASKSVRSKSSRGASKSVRSELFQKSFWVPLASETLYVRIPPVAVRYLPCTYNLYRARTQAKAYKSAIRVKETLKRFVLYTTYVAT